MNTLRPCLFLKGRICRILLFALCLLLYIPGLFAQESGITAQPIFTRLSGATGGLVVGATANLPYPQDNAQVIDKKIVNVITLSIDEESTSYIPEDFTASVTVQIDYGTSSTPTDQKIQTLTVSYKKLGGVTYTPKNYISFNNAQIVNVTVLSPITAPVLSNGLDTKTLLLLKNEMQVTRYYQLSSNSSNLQPVTFTEQAPALNLKPDELPVSWEWSADAGNNGTQLEWTWLDKDLISNYTLSNGQIDYELLFKHNATRIDLPLSTEQYNIPLFYDGEGTLHYRIRAINIVQSGNRQEGPWCNPRSFVYDGHNNNLNWQAVTTYAEEGKRNSVLQYFDGSLRMRQTVTKNNSTNTIVSTETFYDGQGRAAIQILPAPGMTNIVKYNENLNRFNGQTVASDDPALSFDLQPVGGGSATAALIGAASWYYSGSNTEKTTSGNGNIPDAEGYPYTVTRYTPDGTGRILSQSGVGAALKMGSDREIKYYYGNAPKEELYGLFGTDVGDPSHYFKNMVKDANGQMSVSYVDMHGHTIATALAGDPVLTGIKPVLNATDYPRQTGTLINRNLLNLNSNVVKGNSIEALNTIQVPAGTSFDFRYKLNPQELTLATCTPNQSVCYDCLYDLEIVITDESGDKDPIIRRFTNISLSANNDCNTVTSFAKAANETNASIVNNNEITFTEALSAGSYSVRKTLTISETSLQKQKEAWLQVGLCKTEQQLIDSVYGELKIVSGCGTGVTQTPCQSCLAELGNYNAYKANYILNLDPGNLPVESDIQKAYAADVAACEGLCTNRSHKLDIIRMLMLGDMMPYTGQYAQNPDAVSHPSMFDKYNIFSTTNNPPFYKLPANGFPGTRGLYKDVNGNTDVSIHDNPNNLYQKLDNDLTPGGFTEIFSNSWAESLLRFHPEYDRLLFAQTNLTSSYDWIENFNQVTHYSDAVTNNYVNATGHPEYNDPFFTTAPLYYRDAMTNFVSGSWYQGLSLWQMAYGEVRCKTTTDKTNRDLCYTNAPKQPPFTGFTADEMDQAWSIFKNFYGTLRDSLVNDYIKVNKPLPSTDESDLVTQDFILRFPTSVSQQVLQYDWTGFPTEYGAEPTVNLTNELAANTTSKCGSYIDEWKRRLLLCPDIANSPDKETILTEITNGMKAVCEKSLDAGNPYGASNVPDSYEGSPRKFEDVVHSVLQLHFINKSQYCNPFVIESPKPYGKNPVYTKEMITGLDTCNCKQFAKIKQAAAENNYNPADRNSMNEYLNSVYKETLTQALWDGLQHCSELGSNICYQVHVVEAYPCGGGGSTLTAANAKTETTTAAAPLPSDTCYTDYYTTKCDRLWFYPLSSGQPKPAFLNCGYNGPVCISCAQLSQLITDYKTYFNGQACAAAPVLSDDGLTNEEIGYNETFALFVNYRTGLQYDWLQYVKAADATGCNLATYSQNSAQLTNVICADSHALNDTTGMFVNETPCQHTHDMAVALGAYIYKQRKEQLLADFEAAYRQKCMAAKAIEEFSVKYTLTEYHYTLFYYDMAGNLVQTVPPKGARPDFTAQFISDVETAKANGAEYTPHHLYTTKYRYNSLNLVVSQVTPDAGTTNFWYDKLGRLAVSQNEQQLNTPGLNGGSKYSYTLYDELGRIKEVGQKPQTAGMDQATSQNETNLAYWINQGGEAKEEITHTEYDLQAGFNTNGLITQNNLRNRVSYVYNQNKATDPTWYTAIIYSYDVYGNISTILNDYIGVSGIDATNQYKLLKYKYDLVSNKNNEVHYQPGSPDAFYHRYLYDASNRLIEVRTSRDNIVWERDAAYTFYKHGVIKRTEYGQLLTQGLDYSYTLQGWLKGVNVGKPGVDGSGAGCPVGTALDDVIITSRPATNAPSTYTARNSITFDEGFGMDDITNDAYETVIDNTLTVCTPAGSGGSGNITETYPVAQDAWSFSLHYYPGDYKPIDHSIITPPVLETLSAQATPLYNGNIAAMAVDLPGLGTTKVYNYHYDQLNRLKEMDAFDGLNLTAQTFTPVHLNDYLERVSYDPNGNITKYLRNGTTSGGRQLAMDDLTYNYDPNNNQLTSVTDAVTATANYSEDIDGQGTNNYIYDKIGNLKSDNSEKITDIKWTVYGKIASITRNGNDITFTYDAAGNRITKTANNITTVYVRDVKGNVLSVYEKNGSSISQKEINLFGSVRMGMVKVSGNTPVNANMGTGYGTSLISTFIRGEKVYDLTNHLGNVLTTINDRRNSIDAGSDGTIDYYEPNILTANDYYPFGMQMPGRTLNGGNYRYGFNGKENDNEIKGDGNQQDYGMRISDPRLGRFLSVDPIAGKYPELTPYQFASNRPIDGVDQDGLEWYYYSNNVFAPGWQPSKKFGTGLPYTEEFANSLGYYSAAQVHKIQDLTDVYTKQREYEQKVYEYNDAVHDMNMMRNPITMFYKLSPGGTLQDSYTYLSAGQYGAATAMLVGGAIDLAPLFTTFGKAYGTVARNIAARFSFEAAWTKLGAGARGLILEAKMADHYIAQGFTWLAEITPFFKKIDFYHMKSAIAVSFKTVNAEKNFTFDAIYKNIDELAKLKQGRWTVIDGVEREIKQVELHIAVPKGYDMKNLENVRKAAERKLGKANVYIDEL